MVVSFRLIDCHFQKCFKDFLFSTLSMVQKA
jgi:hypothetical protein